MQTLQLSSAYYFGNSSDAPNLHELEPDMFFGLSFLISRGVRHGLEHLGVPRQSAKWLGRASAVVVAVGTFDIVGLLADSAVEAAPDFVADAAIEQIPTAGIDHAADAAIASDAVSHVQDSALEGATTASTLGGVVGVGEISTSLWVDVAVDHISRSKAGREQLVDEWVKSAFEQTATPEFTKWAGDDRVTLAIVFTDIVGSTPLIRTLGDEGMVGLLREHFAQAKKLTAENHGFHLKLTGDGSISLFRSVSRALAYANRLHQCPGDHALGIRAGVHIGPMHVMDGDVYSSTVNYACRVMDSIKGDGVRLSDRAKADMDIHRLNPGNWIKHDAVELKGFGSQTLWSMKTPES